MRTRIAAGAGGAVAWLSRLLGRGGGSVVGGRATLAIDPRALERLAAGHPVALVSGTNGKTTTTSLLRAGLSTLGPVVTNLLGANLPPGITTALANGPAGAPAALEVDEAWLGRVADATAPDVTVLLNLSRDQLDRNNEVRRLSASWRATFAGRPGTTVVANADDPLVVWGAGGSPDVVWVGAGQPWTADASGCPKCGSRVIFPAAQPLASSLQPPDADADAAPGPQPPDAAPQPPDASLQPPDAAPEPPSAGDQPPDAGAGARLPASDATVPEDAGWACSGCELRRPPLAVRIAAGRVSSVDGWSVPIHLALPGRCNQANAALALAAAVRLGADPGAAMEAMATTEEVVGRYRTVNAGGVDARLLLSKNPAGWLEVFDILGPPPAPVVVAINARIADGKDPSWLWDVPFERLRGRLVVATGERSADLAVRLGYAEVEHMRVPDLLDAVGAAGASATATARPVIDVVANYTSFQELRARLGTP